MINVNSFLKHFSLSVCSGVYNVITIIGHNRKRKKCAIIYMSVCGLPRLPGV